MNATRTTCPYCGVGCGVMAGKGAGGEVTIAGDKDHPANFGRLCSKGSALAETIDLDGRLRYPEIGGQRASWDEALDRIANAFAATIAEHGPDSVAMYVSGQLLTEDYYVANKLMKGFIGSANIDTNSRLCMASSVAGHRRAFGSDTVPGTYEDLELADVIVLVGSNLAWCHPVLYQRIAAARQARPKMKIVLIDPRRTATAEIADMHLPIRADGDVALFSGLLLYMAQYGALDPAYIENHTSGFGATLDASIDLDEAARLTGLDAEAVRAFYSLFARTRRVITVYSQGVNQSATGTDKVNAIINCHLATGRIGKPGMGPFSVTGQPNAMGGREVGGLANMLAAHLEIENPAHRDLVRRFWNAPAMAERPGLKAVDMFRAVREGRIKAIWIMATNPVDSMPDADDVAAALQSCPFVAVSDVQASTDTLRYAHVALPALAWGEKDGTVTNSERRISRQRAFLPTPGEARADWRAVCEVAKRMGFGEAFAYGDASEIFAEHAALSAFENEDKRDFDIGAWAKADRQSYDIMLPFQWPQPAGTAASQTRFFGEGSFFTPDRRARFIAVRAAASKDVAANELVLNTGRVRDHWHTMTRTGKSARLSQHLAEPFAELHPDDAARLGIADADIVRLRTTHGEVLLRALITERQSRGSVFAPMHWNDQFAACARIDALVPPITDPVSGQPALKNVAVRVEKFAAAAFGFAVLSEKPQQIAADYWALARCEAGWRLELAWEAPVEDWHRTAAMLFGVDPQASLVAYHDNASAQHRIVAFEQGRMLGALFVAREPVSVSRQWAAQQLLIDHADYGKRLAVAAGRASGSGADIGAIVCSCFGVGANQIAACAARGAGSVAEISRLLKAGSNCGSCRAEIGAIVNAHRLQAAE
jgi:assimilatory nitrate reductase catalytic subunit